MITQPQYTVKFIIPLEKSEMSFLLSYSIIYSNSHVLSNTNFQSSFSRSKTPTAFHPTKYTSSRPTSTTRLELLHPKLDGHQTSSAVPSPSKSPLLLVDLADKIKGFPKPSLCRVFLCFDFG